MYASYDKFYTVVEDVLILRLKFETDGVPYNLGVIDDMISGDLEPDNNNQNELDLIPDWAKDLLKKIEDLFAKFGEKIEKIIQVIALVLILCVLNFFLPIFKIIFNILRIILKIIYYIIVFPFNLIFKKKNKKPKK